MSSEAKLIQEKSCEVVNYHNSPPTPTSTLSAESQRFFRRRLDLTLRSTAFESYERSHKPQVEYRPSRRAALHERFVRKFTSLHDRKSPGAIRTCGRTIAVRWRKFEWSAFRGTPEHGRNAM